MALCRVLFLNRTADSLSFGKGRRIKNRGTHRPRFLIGSLAERFLGNLDLDSEQAFQLKPIYEQNTPRSGSRV